MGTNFLGNEMNQRVDVRWKTGPAAARALLDACQSTGQSDNLRLGYAGTLAVWSRVDSQGHGMNTRNRQINVPDPRSLGFRDWHFQEWYSGERGNRALRQPQRAWGLSG